VAIELLARVRVEIEQRLDDLRPAVAEYERLIGVTDALGTDALGDGEPANSAAPAKRSSRPKGARGSKASARSSATRAARAPHSSGTKAGKADSAAEQAIVAALEHGSHTVAELVLVSALPGADIRAGLRPLLKSGTVMRAKRDGRAAYALSSTA
jgi:hypothetical protein